MWHTIEVYILKKTGRYFDCLERHHMSKDCNSSVSCAKCNGHHHTSVCTGNVITQPTNTQVVPANPSSQAGRNSTPQVGQPITVTRNQSTPTTVTPYIPTTSSRFFCVNSNTPMLLQIHPQTGQPELWYIN